MEPMGVGIVGAGFAGYLHMEGYRRRPDVKVLAVADPDDATLQAFAAKWGIPHTHADYRDLVERTDIDLVSVCTPTSLHGEVAAAALEAGKHVVCEKPITTTLSEAEALLATARRVGRRLFYAEDWCFAPSLVRARDIIAEGGLGRVLYLKGRETHRGSHSPYATSIATCGGGALIHLAIHPIGWAMWQVGSAVKEVFCQVSGGGSANLVHTDVEGEDWSLATITFADGTRALVEGNYLTVGGMDDGVEIFGTDGVIKVELTFGSPMRVYSRPGYDYAMEKADFTHGWTTPAVDERQNLGYPGEIAHFVDCARADRDADPGVRGADGVRVLKVVTAMYESARTGRTVPVED